MLISRLTEGARVETTNIKGLLIGDSGVDPKGISRLLHEMVREDPFSIRWILRFIPIEINCRPDLEQIEIGALSLLPELKEQDKFRITVESRYSDIDSRHLIEAIAKHVRNPVNLEKPDVTILVEIAGGLAGLSVVRPGDIFSALKAKLEP